MNASAPGKIILTGEYAVVFGYHGIAIPAPLTVTATFEQDDSMNDITLQWDTDPRWQEYTEDIINQCIAFGSIPPGTLSITCNIPLGKGMGSSTALVIAITRCLLGENCEKEARCIEDAINPGHSGIDFAVIWDNAPVLFQKDAEPQPIDLPYTLLKGALLIDTGTPDQQTPELVAWVTERKDELGNALETIGSCAERLQNGEDLSSIIRDHNKAQQELGIVTDEAKELITKIEQEGGAAKVIGAGSRTGGCGMILATGVDAKNVPSLYPVLQL